jgi:hypothetical protein
MQQRKSFFAHILHNVSILFTYTLKGHGGSIFILYFIDDQYKFQIITKWNHMEVHLHVFVD